MPQNHPDPEFGPWWAITAVWVDANNDGLLDLFVVNYLQWQYDAAPSGASISYRTPPQRQPPVSGKSVTFVTY